MCREVKSVLEPYRPSLDPLEENGKVRERQDGGKGGEVRERDLLILEKRWVVSVLGGAKR